MSRSFSRRSAREPVVAAGVDSAQASEAPLLVDLRTVDSTLVAEAPLVVDALAVQSAPSPEAPLLVDIRDAEGTPSHLGAHRRVIARWMAVCDGLCAVAALVVARVLSAYHPKPFGAYILLAAVIWICLFALFGLYDADRLSAIEEFRRLLGGTCVATGVVFLSLESPGASARTSLGVMLLVGLVAELGVRRIWRYHLDRLRREGYLVSRTAIVGTNEEAARLAKMMSTSQALGLRPIGYIATGASLRAPDDLPVVARLAHLEEAIRELHIDCVFVAASAVSSRDVAAIASAARHADADVRLSANLAHVLTSRVAIQPLHAVTSLSLKPVRLDGARAVAKRSFDVVVASVALILLLPVFCLIALAIRLTSRGPVRFSQDRVTKDGRVFRMYKFRTMVVDQERALQGHVVDLSEPFFKLDNDPRLTRVGRFLRSYSLDELPQLWNVVRGDLSLVGPRPLPVEQVTLAARCDEMQRRHEVRAGLTGWWQVNGRSLVSADKALDLDLFYINNWSIELDVYILLKTVGVVLMRRGAH